MKRKPDVMTTTFLDPMRTVSDFATASAETF